MESKETNEPQKFKKLKDNKKLRITLIIVIALVLIVLICSTIFALINAKSTSIAKGVSINGVDVSGLSQNEAKEKIDALVNEKLEKEITVSYQDYNTTTNAKVLEVNYDTAPAIDEAYAIGRSGNLFKNNYEIIKSMINKNNININIGLNEETAKASVNDMQANIPDVLEQSSYYIEDNNLIITKGKRGNVIDAQAFVNDIKENYADLSSTKSDIELKVTEQEPDPIDIDKIHTEVYKEAKDAYYNEDPFEIYPEVEGVDFDVEAARKMLEQDQEEYTIPLKITKPKVTINDLSNVAFKDVLSTFSTRYDASNKDRTTNLKLAAGKINGTVVAAGDTFSYNKVVGERTIAAGYKEAKVYSGGDVVDGIGGGICQISSTLYNTVLLANLEVTERRNHQFVTSYLPAGRDATVVYGSQDFKFKNTRKYPVKIEATVSNGIAKISLYGIKENPEYDISFQTKTISTIPFTTVYQDDASIPAGTEKVKRNGANGLVTETYKITKSGGKVVSKTLLSKDVYNAMQKIVLRNSSAKATEPAVEQTPSATIIDETKVPQTNTTTTPSTETTPEETPKQ